MLEAPAAARAARRLKNSQKFRSVRLAPAPIFSHDPSLLIAADHERGEARSRKRYGGFERGQTFNRDFENDRVWVESCRS
jgi:hypothetical protein